MRGSLPCQPGCDCGKHSAFHAGPAKCLPGCQCRRHDGPGRPATPWRERFYNLCVEVSNGCWIWISHLDKVVGVDPRCDPVFSWYEDGEHKTKRAARFIYEMEVEPIPDGYELDHKCEDWRCVNWTKCLEPVTLLENNRRYRATRKLWTVRDEYGRFAGKKAGEAK